LLASYTSPSWRTTPCQLSVTAYSIYFQLFSICGGSQPKDKPSLADDSLSKGIINRTSINTTTWSRVLPEKLTVSQLIKKFPALYGARRFITVFTIAYSKPVHTSPPYFPFYKYELQVKVKVKVSCPCVFLTEHHTMEAYWRSGGIAPRIL